MDYFCTFIFLNSQILEVMLKIRILLVLPDKTCSFGRNLPFLLSFRCVIVLYMRLAVTLNEFIASFLCIIFTDTYSTLHLSIYPKVSQNCNICNCWRKYFQIQVLDELIIEVHTNFTCIPPVVDYLLLSKQKLSKNFPQPCFTFYK